MGVPALRGLILPCARCFAACLLVDQGRSLLAFCITKERALRRPWRDAFASDESTKRKSCGMGTVGWERFIALASCSWSSITRFSAPGPAGRRVADLMSWVLVAVQLNRIGQSVRRGQYQSQGLGIDACSSPSLLACSVSGAGLRLPRTSDESGVPGGAAEAVQLSTARLVLGC